MKYKTIEKGHVWSIWKDIEVYRLIIHEGGRIVGPEGKVPVLIVNGVVRDIEPGTYIGEVKICLNKTYIMPPRGMMAMSGQTTNFLSAVTVENNHILADKSIMSAVAGGSVTGRLLQDAYIVCHAANFNGVLLVGDTDYRIANVRMDLDGPGINDFIGVGSAVAAFDDVKLTIDHCNFTITGVTRCALHVGGNSEVTVNDSEFTNLSPMGPWLDSFSWACGFLGTNRLAQLTEGGSVTYNRCRLKSNGWGVLSIDGGFGVKMYVKDSLMELSGPMSHGYGAFCIGTNSVTLDHTTADVNGYPLMVMGDFGLGRASVINGSVLRGARFGIMVHKDENSLVTVENSSIHSGKSCICVKGSATTFDIKNSELHAENGVILQLMDTDEKDMTTVDFRIPVGVLDIRKPERDIFTEHPLEDVILNIFECVLEGDFYNSTTEIRAFENGTDGDCGLFMMRNGGALRMDGLDDPPEGRPMPPAPTFADGEDHPVGHDTNLDKHNGDDLQGAKNLVLHLRKSKVTGIISSATQHYRDGLALIDESNRLELSNITQIAAEPVNNGVLLTLDSESVWTVAGDSWLTGLYLEPGAVVAAPEGMRVSMTVNGAPVECSHGNYSGIIHLWVHKISDERTVDRT